MSKKEKFKISYQGTLDTFCGVYAVINAVGVACSGFKIFTYMEKAVLFKYYLKYLLNENLMEQVIEHGTTCTLEEKYLRLAQKYMKEKYHILIQWRKFSSLKRWRNLNFEKIFYILSRWIKRKNHSCIVRVDTPQTGDHWTVFKKVKFPMCYVTDSYHFLKMNFIKLAWKTRRGKNKNKETQIMKEGIFFISAKKIR